MNLTSLLNLLLLLFIPYTLAVSDSGYDSGYDTDSESPTTPERTVIGIDLGTTVSVVAYFNPATNSVDILPNIDGSTLTPSYALLHEDNTWKIGQGAKDDVSGNPNKFWDAKRLIGRSFSSAEVQSCIKNWPFTIRQNSSNVNPAFVSYKREGSKWKANREIRPEEISAEVLSYLVSSAEAKIGRKVTDAVITVPAYFDSQQKQATVDAAEIAGINVLRTIAEPTAAAVAYGLERKKEEDLNILVFDLGGGTFDVSILESSDGFFNVQGSGGDPHLGGQDFDNIIMEMFCKEAGVKSTEMKKSDLKALKNLAEAAKIELSEKTSAKIEMKLSVNKQMVKKSLQVSRNQFEDALEKKYGKKIRSAVEKLFRQTKVSKKEIDEVVLVGGSSRIPFIRRLVKEITGKTGKIDVDPDLAIAHGAALQAAALAGVESEKIEDLIIADVIPLALGIETTGGVMTPVVEANEKIPIKKVQKFSPASASQEGVTINIYQGPYKMVKKNTLLGTINLKNIGKNFPEIEIEFDVDENGLTKVSAHEKGNNQKGEETIKNAGNMSEEDKKKIMADFEKRREEDERESKVVGGKENIRRIVEKVMEKNGDNKELKEKFDEVLKEAEEIKEFNAESFEKIEKLEEKLKSIIQVAGVGADSGEQADEGKDEEFDAEDEDDEL